MQAPPTRRAFVYDTTAVVAAALALRLDFAHALRVDGDQAVYPVPSQDGATVDRDHAVILVRYDNAVYAFVLWCPHQHTPLRWHDADRQFECPKHHSTFRPDGAFIEGRATRAMDRYALRRDGATIIVELGTVYQQDADQAAWNAAAVKL